MKILAIESSGTVASAAMLDGETVTALISSDYKKTHSQTLLPMIDEVIKMTDSELDGVDAIAVSGGPGSFTGLRIGGTTAKGLALAADKPVIHVPTLEALAYNLYTTEGFICPIMDARRGQVYTGLYRFDDGLGTHLDGCARDITELLEWLDKHMSDGERVTFLGDGVPVFKDRIEAFFSDKNYRVFFAPAHLSRQSAASVAVLGAKMFDAGQYMHADDFVPNYLRQSQAEREYTDIKPIEDSDTEAVAAMEAEAFDDAWSADSIRKTLEGRCNGGLIARHNGEPVGYLLFQKVAGEGELLRIAVRPSYRRAGIARRLMTVMEEDKNTDLWSLEVRAGNAPAIGLYRAMNYSDCRIRQDYYSNPVEDALIMEHKIRA